jgi:hypothetical protein
MSPEASERRVVLRAGERYQFLWSAHANWDVWPVKERARKAQRPGSPRLIDSFALFRVILSAR